MKINKRMFEEFGTKANSFTYQPLSIDATLFQPDKSIYPVSGEYVLKPKQMSLVAEFRSKLDISNFMAEILLHKENIIDIEDGYIYKCYFTGSTTPVSEYWQGWYRITLPFLAIQMGSERIVHLNDIENHISIAGNWKAGCIYEITPLKDIETITIAGIQISNLYTNKLVTVDGVLKKVYSPSEPNKYSDCVFPDNEFPCVTPGANIIRISTKDAKVKLKYNPIYA